MATITPSEFGFIAEHVANQMKRGLITRDEMLAKVTEASLSLAGGETWEASDPALFALARQIMEGAPA